jgi:hypothetical protein
MMNQKNNMYILFCVLTILLTACEPSQSELNKNATSIAANIFATLTAQPPTATLTPSPTITKTPTATLFPTPTLPPVIDGWRTYSYPDFSINAPEQWRLFYVGNGQVEQVLKSLQSTNHEWDNIAKELISQITGNDNEYEAFRLMAIDPNAFYTNHSSFLIEKYPTDGQYTIPQLCTKFIDHAKKQTLKVVHVNCNDHLNGKTAFQFTLQATTKSADVYDIQYFVFDGEWVWLIEYIVETPGEKDGAPVFTEIANSFKILNP